MQLPGGRKNGMSDSEAAHGEEEAVARVAQRRVRGERARLVAGEQLGYLIEGRNVVSVRLVEQHPLRPNLPWNLI